MRIGQTFVAAGLLGGLYIISNIEGIRNVESPGSQVSTLEQITSAPDMVKPVKKEISREERLRFFADYIAPFEVQGNEHRIHRVYDGNADKKIYEPNIGIGHNLSSPKSRRIFRDALPGVEHPKVLQGKQSLTKDQIKKLFAYDLEEHYETARRLVPEIDNLPLEVGAAITSIVYRGERVPKTIALINQGDFYGAANEYTGNSPEYRSAESKGMRGIIVRRDANRKALIEYAASLAARKSSEKQ